MTQNKEETPFVIDFKQRNSGNYGTAIMSENSTFNNPSGSHEIAAQNNNNTDLRPVASTIYCLHGQSHVEVRDHCHRQRSEGVDIKARKKLIIASALCLFFMICEIIGGVLSNSLAIATDAAHLLTDFASFMISLFAIWIAGRPSTQRMSFGWYRAEVIGALASVVMIWFITAILVWLAIERILTQTFELNAKIMLITSGLAILVNIIMGLQLQHGHTHGGGLGHSHGVPKKTKKSNKCSIPDPTGLSTTHKLDSDAITKEAKCKSLTIGCCEDTNAVPICPASPTERIEDGVVDMAAVDAELPAAGLRTFSYQNSQSVNEVHAEIAAVMAETSPGHHHHGGDAAKDAVNLNVRAAFIHVLGDIVQSVGVFIAALIIFFKPEWGIADPICTFIFSIIVLFTTFAIMKDALLVLMEGTPSYLHYAEVLNIFKNIQGVERVHNLRIWALSINKIALSVHLAIGPDTNPKNILDQATKAVHTRYNFFETTIQIEDVTPQMESCQQCNAPIK